MLKQRGRRIAVNLYGRSTRMRLVDVVARVFKVPDRDLRIVGTEALAPKRWHRSVGRWSRPRSVLQHVPAGGREIGRAHV